MNKYRIIEVKDQYGFTWYLPQRLSPDNTWEDISQGWINKEAAMERIRRDLTQKVVWEGTDEDILSPMREFQGEINND